MQTHQENLSQYAQLGGDQKKVKIYLAPTLENRAKVMAMLKVLQKKTGNFTIIKPSSPLIEVTATITEISTPLPAQSTPTHSLLGLIVQYPEQLHATYKKAFNCWLDACALKLKLNKIPVENVDEAYDLEEEIHSLMMQFDAAKKALDYYNKEKSILPTECKKDLKDFSPLELFKQLKNLRPLITRRKQTLENKIKNLPPETDPKYRARKSIISKKTEELEVYILELKKIEEKLAQ